MYEGTSPSPACDLREALNKRIRQIEFVANDCSVSAKEALDEADAYFSPRPSVLRASWGCGECGADQSIARLPGTPCGTATPWDRRQLQGVLGL